MYTSRDATKAGTWYKDSERELSAQLDGWLQAAKTEMGEITETAKAILCPHAGYA